MPAKAATIQNPQVNPGRRRFLNLDLLVKITVPLLLIFLLLIAVEMESFGWYARLFRRNTYTTFLGSLGAIYTLAFLVMQSVRTVLWWRYRPYSLPSGPLPKVTVLIPAYNEGAMVEKALYSVAAADYPKDRLEIICIDDGSRDDTWDLSEKLANASPT
jgi:hyaluronan synthase